MKTKILLFIFILLGSFPVIIASNYSEDIYGGGIYGQEYGIVDNPKVISYGGRGARIPIQFEVNILEVSDTLNLGESFVFNYSIKGIGKINHEIIIDLLIEKDGEIISSDSNLIYFGINEEKNVTASLFLPRGIESGSYQLKVKANYESIIGESRKTIRLGVEKEVAKIEQLFDITFSIDEIKIENSNDLVAIITFVNFGDIATKFNLTYIILDSEGKNVFSEEDIATIELEKVIKKDFIGLNLPEGQYTIILKTFYGENIYDEFEQSFQIIKREKNQMYFLILLFAIIVSILILLFLLKNKKKIHKKSIKRILKNKKRFVKRISYRTKKGGRENLMEKKKNTKKKVRKSFIKKIKEILNSIKEDKKELLILKNNELKNLKIREKREIRIIKERIKAQKEEILRRYEQSKKI